MAESEECVVEVSKRLIYLSAEHPSETQFDFKLEAGITGIPVGESGLGSIGVGVGTDTVVIKSNASFAFAITVTNKTGHEIVITSLLDPLLTLHNICGTGSSFINFLPPVYSDKCVNLNQCFRKNGELVGKDKIKLKPKEIGVFVIKGFLNTRKLTINNFVILTYKRVGHHKEYIVKSDEECFKLQNDLEFEPVGHVM